MSWFISFAVPPLSIRDGARRRYRQATREQILAAARQVIDLKVQRGASMGSPTAVRTYLRTTLSGYDYEVFSLLPFDTRHRLIEYVELFRSTIDGASVHPREVVRESSGRSCRSAPERRRRSPVWFEPKLKRA